MTSDTDLESYFRRTFGEGEYDKQNKAYKLPKHTPLAIAACENREKPTNTREEEFEGFWSMKPKKQSKKNAR
jgi:hypothetical protein